MMIANFIYVFSKYDADLLLGHGFECLYGNTYHSKDGERKEFFVFSNSKDAIIPLEKDKYVQTNTVLFSRPEMGGLLFCTENGGDY